MRCKIMGVVGGMLLCALAMGAPAINSVDLNETTNKSIAETKRYKTPTDPRLVLRRSARYFMSFTTNKDVPAANWNYSVKAKRLWNNTELAIAEYNGVGPVPNTWWFQKSGVTTRPTDLSFSFQLNAPTDAEVGTYEFRIEANVTVAPGRGIDVPGLGLTKIFPKKIVVLFNPYAGADAVSMPDKKDRQEYVENESGRWVNGKPEQALWNVAQFEEVTLNVFNYLLDQTPGLDRKSPTHVTREISGSCNWRYWSQGIIEGRWAKDFPGGKKPGFWSGTDELLGVYTTAGPPYTTVKYGQCWVFANVSNSLLRCAGVPARTVSVFLTAIDNSSPPDGHVDRYFSYNAGAKTYFYDRLQTIDSWWNYHVWTEAWMKRPDLAGGDGWQCIDATSQAEGPGLTKIGPASREIIRAAGTPPNTSDYNAGFMWASALSDYRELREDKTAPGTYAVDLTKTNANAGFAQYVWTKELNQPDVVDIAAEYRPGPRPADSVGGSTLSNSFFSVQFIAPPAMSVGQDVTGVVRITNGPGASRTFSSTFGADLTFYDGQLVTTLAEPTWNDVILAPGQFIDLTLTISAAQIAANMGQTEEFVRWHGAINCDAINVVEYIGGPGNTGATGLVGPPITLSLSPPSLTPGGATSTLSTFTNTSGMTLTNVSVTLACGSLLSIAGGSSVTFSLPNLGPGAAASIPSVNVTAAMALGNSAVGVSLQCDQLPPSSTTASIAIASCAGDLNGDGLVDDQDFVIFAAAYDTLVCDSPDMDAGCPADLNHDGYVDDIDFVLFAQAYNDLLCP